MGKGVFFSVEMGELLGEEETGAVGLIEEAICAAKVFEKRATPKKNGLNAEAEKKNAEGKKTTCVAC
jgi:hypothetical protein